MQFFDIVGRFKNSRRLSGNSYQVACPCHRDSENSLTITEKGDKILMYCHAGCNTRDILGAVGLTMADLNNGIKPKVSTWRTELEAKMGKLEAVYDYGQYMKLRFKGKKILYGVLKNEQFTKGIDGIPRTLYNIEAVQKAMKDNYAVYIVEGEKDVDTLKKYGYSATTAGGASDWKKEYAQYFKGARVVILPDNDEAGQKLCRRIQKDLQNIASAIKVVHTSNSPKGDVTDYFNEGNSIKDFKRLVERSEYVWADWLVVNNDLPVRVNPDKLAHSISKNLDYIILKKKGSEVADFYVYTKGVYEKCSKQEFKSYIKSYIPLGFASDNILNNIYSLLGCISEKILEFDEADSNENIINLKNGVLDIDKNILMEHSPKYISTIQLNCNYDPQAKATRFLEFINRLCSDKNGNVDNEKLLLIQEWTGLLLSNINVSRVKKCFLLYSAVGNTGKSVFLNMICKILGGKHTINIPIQNMSDRFALSDLYGKRLDVVGDQRADAIENSSGFKQLTGGDRVKVEFKGKQSFDWTFRGGIVVSCNNLPYFADDKGGHIFERLSIIPCENSIPLEERDGTLIDKVTEESDGIFLWALEGLKRLRDNNYRFTKCEATENIIYEYRSKMDTIFRFIDECYAKTKNRQDRVKKSEFEAKYQKWCVENEHTALKKKNIKERVEKNGIDCIKSNGIYVYVGLVEKEFFEIDEREEQLPIEFQ